MLFVVRLFIGGALFNSVKKEGDIVMNFMNESDDIDDLEDWDDAKELFSSRSLPMMVHKTKYVLSGIVVGLVIALLFGIFLLGRKSAERDDPDKTFLDVTQIDADRGVSVNKEVTIEFVSKKLANLAELSTAQMSYTGIYSVEEGSIPFITKKGFSMIYTASIKSGIDMSLIDVEVTDSQVLVKLPDAEIQTIKVEPSSIQFYDEKHALLNRDEKGDAVEAIRIAEGDLESKTDFKDLLQLTSERAELLVENLLSDSIGDKTLVIM